MLGVPLASFFFYVYVRYAVGHLGRYISQMVGVDIG